MSETKLGAYYISVGNIETEIEKMERYGYFSPFDFYRIQELIDEASNSLCASFKDGSFVSRSLYA